MSTSDEFKTHAELQAANDFIQYLEELYSGAPDTGTGINRPLGRLARNTDAILDALQAHRIQFVTGGGVISWASGLGLFWTSTIVINFANTIAGASNNVITAANFAIAASGDVLYAQVDRTTSGASIVGSIATDTFANFLTLLTGNADRLDFLVLAYRDGNDLILWDGRRILDGESIINNGYTDTQYGQQDELTTVHENLIQNSMIRLTDGGIITWDAGTSTLTWADDFFIEVATATGDNTILANSAVVPPNNLIYVDLDRTPGAATIDISGTLTISGAVPGGTSPYADDRYVLAIRGADDRIYLADGTALSDGDSVLLGGLQSGVQFFYYEDGTGTQVTDLTEGGTFPARSYVVGTGSLMVYRNGVKAKGSEAHWGGGTYPGAGGLVGGALNVDDEYVEQDTGDGTGNTIIWLADGQAVAEPLFHPAASHSPPFTWPAATDHLETFVGLQGKGPSPVESVGRLGGTALEGDVKLEQGANITLTENLGNNSVVIAASVTAGVASLEDPDGAAVARTGVLKLRGGTKITLDNSTTADEFVFNNDVENLVDLDDVDADQSDAFAGMQDPSATNTIATLNDSDFIHGFDLIWCFDTDASGGGSAPIVRTAGGVLRSNGVIYRQRGTSFEAGNAHIEANTFDIGPDGLGGSDAWKYLYLGPGGLVGGQPELVFDQTPPTMASYGSHPNDSDYKFLSSVYKTTGNDFEFFTKEGNWVSLSGDFLDVTADFAGKATGSYETVQLGSLSSISLPATGVTRVRIKLTLVTTTAAGAVSFGMGTRQINSSSSRSYTFTGPGTGATTGRITLEIEVNLSESSAVGGDRAFEISLDSTYANFDSAVVVGYSEGRMTAADSMGDW